MERLSSSMVKKPDYPVKVLQFGEGNFLRAFVDYMIDIANEKTDFAGSIVLVKPIDFGVLPEDFALQDNLYTVLLRGLVDGQPTEESRVITSVAETISCYGDYSRYSSYARCPSLRFIVSNTTEAGIVLDSTDEFSLCPPKSYPGKLTKFLFERAEYFGYAPDKGLVILPVELIADNGIELKKCVMELCQRWNLGERFINWLEECCVFTSTLVDRIVTGYPRGEDKDIWEKLGYEDHLLDTAEPFGLWVIESRKDIARELPLAECGLPVIFTDDHHPYKQRKVRILNGAHTSFVPAAFLCGHNIVLEAMNDPVLLNFMEHTLYDEVIPTLTLDKQDLIEFAEAVKSRFSNPFIKHSLLAICLNCVSKWRARCLPSLVDYVGKAGKLPEHLTFSLASLMALYHGGKLEGNVLVCRRGEEEYRLQDDMPVLEFFASSCSMENDETVHAFLSREDFFGMDLTAIPGLEESVASSFSLILEKGMRCVLEEKFPV